MRFIKVNEILSSRLLFTQEYGLDEVTLKKKKKKKKKEKERKKKNLTFVWRAKLRIHSNVVDSMVADYL